MTKPELHVPTVMQILIEAAEAAALAHGFPDPECGFVVRISNGLQSFYAGGGQFPTYPINQAINTKICADKALCLALLKQAGLRVPEGDHFFVMDEGGEHYGLTKNLFAVQALLQRLSFPLIFKPNTGSGGKGIELVHNEDELITAVRAMSDKDHVFLLQEYIQLPEYRIFCIDGQPQFIYRKHPPQIVGDGQSDIQTLLMGAKLTEKTDLGQLMGKLRALNLKSDTVLPKGKPLILTHTSNISKGASIKDLTTRVPAELAGICTTIFQTLGIRVFGLDCFLSPEKKITDNCIILEVNSNPSLSGLWQAGHKSLCLSIWQKIFDLTFNDKNCPIDKVPSQQPNEMRD